MTRRRFEFKAEVDAHTVEVDVFFWETIGGVEVGPRLLVSASFIGMMHPAPHEDLRDILRGISAQL